MRTGQASRTAELVCIGRALAHGRVLAPGFQDPTALALLPPDARERVEQLRANVRQHGLRAKLTALYHQTQARVMVVRTLAIDAAIRAAHTPQVVILGAGLDGRAFRMPELRDSVVFEVDHPDSQPDKRARSANLTACARTLRFVAVDFERDSLDAALGAAGHDRALATTWVWEGVVMYLAPADVDATLAVIERRSAPRSRLIVLYHSPKPLLRVVGFFVRRLGEPLRSSFTPD